jgi:DNA-binding NarL/FixJ family response regulator
VLLAGEAGVGKTALARHALARTGLAVLESAAVPGGPAFGPVVEVLRAHLRAGGALVEGPLRPHLALLLPELGPAVGGDRATLHEAVRRSLSDIAQRAPTAVFLDDLQWADAATLELLPALTCLFDGGRLLIVGAYRTDELPRARRMRGALRRTERLVHVGVDPLDVAGTAALLTAILGPVAPALQRTVHDRTDGIPLFVDELAGALSVRGVLRPGPSGLELADGTDVPLPEGVRDAVLLRAAGLSAGAQAASVIGVTFDPDEAATIAGLVEWPDEPARHGIVTDVGPATVFRHALVRDAFYEEIPSTCRAALHRAVAQRLAEAGAAPLTVAAHWEHGHRPDLARRALLAAAQGCSAVHAYRDAARAARHALDLWPGDGAPDRDEPGRVRALELLAQCQERAGELADAATTWREAADAHRGVGAESELGAAHHRLAAALELQGRWPEALASREQAAVAFTAAGSPAEAAAERIAAAAHLRSAGSFRAAVSLLEIAGRQAEAAGRVDLQARVLGHFGNARARMGDPAGIELVRTGLALALEHGLTGPAAEVYQRLADALEHGGDYPGARQTYDEAVTFCSTNALEPTVQLCLACLTAVLRQTGDWDRAVQLCRQVLDSPDAELHARTVATGMLGSILGLRGRSRRARPLLLESVTLARRNELAAMELLAAWGLAIVDRDDGATAAAATHCTTVLERWRETEDRHYAITPLRWATTFHAESGAAGPARACAAALARIATDSHQDEALSALLHALGETALLDGAPEQAVEQFGRAVGLLQFVDVPFDRAESQRRLAAALIASDRREEAVEHLVAAYRTARRLQARPLQDRLAAELAALGERADRWSGAGTQSSLTRREVEVVRLVATGRTNREIAHELFLSTRTVEMHVSRILGKLDRPTRAGAAQRARELGLLAVPG